MVDTYRLFSHRILMLIGMLGCAVSVDAQALKLERQVIGVAGRTLSSGGLTLEWTAGQVSASLLKPVSGTWPALQQGFHQGLCDLQGTLSINADTDTLTCEKTSIQLNGETTIPDIQQSFWILPGGNQSSGTYISATQPGIYQFIITRDGCSQVSSILIVRDTLTPTLDLTPDNPILTCLQPNIQLSGSSIPDAHFQWSTGETSTSITVDFPDTYSITVTNQANGCSKALTLEVVSSKSIPDVQIMEIEKDCEKVLLRAVGSDINEVTLLWFPGDSNPTFSEWVVNKPGTYTLLATDQNGCTKQSTLSVELQSETPLTFISPNEDGKNDRLKVNRCRLSGRYEVTIFNRWGQLVLQSNNFEQDYPQGWDGTHNGQSLPDGQYYYIVEHAGVLSRSPLTILR